MADNDNNTGNVLLIIVAIIAILVIAFYAIQYLRPVDTNNADITIPDIDVIPGDGNSNDVTP